MSILGVTKFRMGEATQRYLTHFFGRNDRDGVNRVLGPTLTLYLVVCAISVLGLFVRAPVLSQIFEVPEVQYDLLTQLLWLPALIFTLGFVFGYACSLGVGLAPYSRTVVLPVLTGAAAFIVQYEIHERTPADSWIVPLTLGGLFAGITLLLLIGADWALGEAEAPSRHFVARLSFSPRLAPFSIGIKQGRE